MGVPGSQRWIWVCGWERFQHYRDRNPHWIKFYTELLHDDDYLDLTSHRRGVLHGLWLAFASSQRQLRADPRKLSSRLHMRVTSSDLTSLNHAGFVLFVDSNGLAGCEQMYSTVLARRKQAAIPEAEADTDKESGSPINVSPIRGLPDKKIEDILACCNNVDAKSKSALSHAAKGLPESSLAKVLESCRRFRGEVGVGYAINALKSEAKERRTA